jgi:hypothetical protein
MTSCVDGNVTDSCEPGTGRPDSNCDGVDDDCDGATDEAFRSEPTTCGEGVCEGRGMTSCVDGTVTDSCEPGTGQPDSNCDGVDDDCDGSVDESFRSEPTTCGEGACEGRGMTYCADGTVNDTCEAGSGARPDTSCDGVDDDCDGSTDEAFRSSSTTCGDGECYARGMTACVGGAVVDTCEPLDPTTEICEDGIDQDCDGAADNGCECPAPAPGLVYAVASAHSDECHGGSDMHSISLPGFFDGVGSSEALFSFNDDAIFEWSDDGLTARVTGSATLTGADAAHAYEIGSEWWVDVVVNYRGAGALGEGSGGPVLALASACQPASLTSAWEYFDMLDGDAVISRMDDPTDFALFTMFPAGGVHPVPGRLRREQQERRNGTLGRARVRALQARRLRDDEHRRADGGPRLPVASGSTVSRPTRSRAGPGASASGPARGVSGPLGRAHRSRRDAVDPPEPAQATAPAEQAPSRTAR